MKAVVAAFNQEKALVGAFSVITNLRIEFGWNFLKHYSAALDTAAAEVMFTSADQATSSGDGGQSSQVILTCTTVIINWGACPHRRRFVDNV